MQFGFIPCLLGRFFLTLLHIILGSYLIQLNLVKKKKKNKKKKKVKYSIVNFSSELFNFHRNRESTKAVTSVTRDQTGKAGTKYWVE